MNTKAIPHGILYINCLRSKNLPKIKLKLCSEHRVPLRNVLILVSMLSEMIISISKSPIKVTFLIVVLMGTGE